MALALLVSVSLGGCSFERMDAMISDLPYSIGSGNLFRMDESRCPLAEARLYLYNYSAIYGGTYGRNLWDMDFEGQTLEEYVKNVSLEELTRIYCMDLLAEQQEIFLSEEEEALCAQAAELYYASLSEEALSYIDISETLLEEIYAHYALADKLYQELTASVNSEISDDEARVMKVQQILVTDEASAQSAAEKLEEGMEFTAVAASYSTAREVELYVDRDTYPEEVTEAAYNLDEGTFSDAIETDGCWYFIKVIDKYDEELTEDHKKDILETRREALFKASYDPSAQEADYRLKSSEWEQMEPVSADSSLPGFFEIYEEVFGQNGEE